MSVKGLIWRSHTDRFRFSSSENDHLGDEIEAAGGECVRDMRRTGGSHHQKFVVLSHPGHAQLDVADVGGIDLCHSRDDDSSRDGGPQASQIAAVYGNGRRGTTSRRRSRARPSARWRPPPGNGGTTSRCCRATRCTPACA